MADIVKMLSDVLNPATSYIMTCVSDRYEDRCSHKLYDRESRQKTIDAHDVARGALIEDVLFYEMKDFYLKDENLPSQTLFIKVDGRMVAHILPGSKVIVWKMKSPALESYVAERAEILQERVFKHMREANAAELAQKKRIEEYDRSFAERFSL